MESDMVLSGGEMVWGVGNASVCIACCCKRLALVALVCAVFSGVVEIVPVVGVWLFGIVAIVPYVGWCKVLGCPNCPIVCIASSGAMPGPYLASQS